MKVFLTTTLLAFVAACGSSSTVNNTVPKPGSATTSSPSPTPAPVAEPSTPKNGDYPGKGVVTKIDLQNGSVEMDHEDIKGVMPAMQMEFYVSDKKLLDGLKVGDHVDFTLRYKDHTETVIDIKKAK